MKKVDKLWMSWRINNWFFRHHMAFVAEIGRFIIRVVCSADIPPQVSIGKGTKFPHMGLGVLFHPNVRIGNDCVILHGVTIGGKKGHARLPRIGNSVFIGAGAIILGDIEIGDNCTIGAGSVVTKSILPNTVVAGNPARIITPTPLTL